MSARLSPTDTQEGSSFGSGPSCLRAARSGCGHAVQV
jgi:hypothetical protein